MIRNPEDDKDWTPVEPDSTPFIEGNTNGADRDGANAKKSNRSYKNKDFLRLNGLDNAAGQLNCRRVAFYAVSRSGRNSRKVCTLQTLPACDKPFEGARIFAACWDTEQINTTI